MPPTISEPEGRRARRRRELRERVYEVSRELFQKHGFEATTVEQIAEAADIVPQPSSTTSRASGACWP